MCPYCRELWSTELKACVVNEGVISGPPRSRGERAELPEGWLRWSPAACSLSHAQNLTTRGLLRLAFMKHKVWGFIHVLHLSVIHPY